MATDFVDSVLMPLSYLGLYTEETPPDDVLKCFKKEKIEFEFANLVKMERKQPNEERKKFIVEYGRFFRTCPHVLDFAFVEQPLGYFVKRLQNPALITLSAMIYNESMIHKTKQNPCEENFKDLKKSISTLENINVASNSQEGLLFPPLFADLFPTSLDHAKKFPYSAIIPQQKSVSSGIVVDPSSSASVGLGVHLDKKPRFNWANLPSLVKSLPKMESSRSHAPSSQSHAPSSQSHAPSSRSHAPKSSQSHAPKSSQSHAPKSSQIHAPKSSQSHALKSSETDDLKSSQSHALKTSQTDWKSSHTDNLKSSQTHAPKSSQTDYLKSSQSHAPKSLQSDAPKSSQSDEMKYSQSDELRSSQSDEPEWTTVKKKKRKKSNNSGKKNMRSNPEGNPESDRKRPKKAKKSKRRSFSQDRNERPADTVSSDNLKPKRLNWDTIPKFQKEVDSDEEIYSTDDYLETTPTNDELEHDPTNNKFGELVPELIDASFETYTADDEKDTADDEKDTADDEKDTADDEKEKKDTADDEKEEKDTADDEKEEKDTADDEKEEKDTADDEKEEKDTADDEKEEKDTADDEKEEKDIADDKKEEKDTADDEKEEKDAIEVVDADLEMCDSNDEISNIDDETDTADDKKEEKDTADDEKDAIEVVDADLEMCDSNDETSIIDETEKDGTEMVDVDVENYCTPNSFKDVIDLTGEDNVLNGPQDMDHFMGYHFMAEIENLTSDDEKLLKIAQDEEEKSNTDKIVESKISYSKLLHRSAEELIKIIDEEELPPIYTDSSRSLLLYLIDNDKVDIDSESLEILRNSRSSRYFKILEKCFVKWPNEEIASDEKTDYGTKKIIFKDNPNSFLKTRNYKQMKKSRGKSQIENPVSRYYCAGGKVCKNDSCLFKKCYQEENLVSEKRNTSQFVEENENGFINTYCLYCKSDGIKDSTVENVSCNARLYWKTNTNAVYALNSHSCFPLHCITVPESFKEGFDRKLGYISEVKHNIRKQLENPQTSVEDMYKNASKISVGSKKGPQTKIELMGRPSLVKTRLDETVKRLKALDKNFILEYSSDCIVTSSTKSLRKALQFDIEHGIFTEPGFIDCCFSRVQGTSWVACSIYFYEPIGRSVIKVCNGYIPSENMLSVTKVISIFNRGIRQLIIEEKLLGSEQLTQIEEHGFRLQPRQFYVDFNDVNHAAFISAGYSVPTVNKMLEGCGKHFKDMVETLKVPFKGEDKQLIETHLFNWKNCIIIDKIQSYFDTIITFVIRKIKDEKVREEIMGQLKWWKDRLPCWSKAFSGIKHVDANLAEVGHSHSLKHSSIDEAIIDDVVTNFHDFGKLIAVGEGSLKAVGAGPDYEHIQTLKQIDMNCKMTQIENEFHNPTPDASNENLGDYDIDDEIMVPETTSVPISKKRATRTVKSIEFKQNHTNSRKLQVSVRQIIEDTPIKKKIKVYVTQQYGRYNKGELIVLSFESSPSCSCSYCTKLSSRNGRKEVCSPQIWLREHLLGMSETSVHIIQVYFSPDVVENLLRSWRPPVVDSEVDLRESFRLGEIKWKCPKEKITYYLEKTSVHTTRKRCFGSCHAKYGKEINTPPGSLIICAENALKVPMTKTEAVPGPVYMCATKQSRSAHTQIHPGEQILHQRVHQVQSLSETR